MTTPLVGVGDFTGTVSPVPADVLMDSQGLVVLAANASQAFGPYLMTQPSYAIAVDALMNVAATLTAVTVTMRWSDPGTGFLVDQERWHVPGVISSPATNTGLTIGRGPTKAASLLVTIKNTDTVNSITVDLNVWQSSRVVTRDDWRGFQESANIPVWSVGDREPNSNNLGSVTAVNVNAGITTSWLAAMYSGQAQLNLTLSAIANVTVSVFAPFADVGSTHWPALWAPNPTPTSALVYLSLPRCPVVVQVANASAGAITVSWSLTIQEFAT